jgi:hypothetical protein
MVVGPLLDALDEGLTAAGVRIVHLKMMDQCESGYVKAAVTANRQEPAVEGVLDASPARDHELLINLRALGAPEVIRRIVERAAHGRRAEWRALEAFRPAAPAPYHKDGRELPA